MNDVITHANVEVAQADATAPVVLPQGNAQGNAQGNVVLPKGNKKMAQPKAATLRHPLADGDVAKRSFLLLDDNKVRAEYTFRTDTNSTDRYPIATVFDFGNCSREDILFLASSSVRITIQGKLRSMGNSAFDVTVFAKVDVKRDVVDAQKSQVDETIRGIRALARAAGISEARAREIIETEAAKTQRK